MHTQPSGRPAEWFPSSVTLKDCGPYPAEVLGHRHEEMVLPRFTTEVTRRITAEFRSDASITLNLRFTGEGVEILGLGDPPKGLEHCRPDAEGRYTLGHAFLPWREHTTTDPAELTRALVEAQAGGYPPTALDAWTVAFADHGHRMAVLAVYRTPDEDPAAYDALYNVLYANGLSSYEITAARADDAELAARRWFSSQRAHLEPDTVVWPKVAPATRLPADPR
ncbi:hypothetical protein [Streptomyces sp. NPDC007355]|uniref:hypothetical protein n=1 Tax=Streptomyces sp. NPDC007355 TaxID=3364778 RepID=UPI003699E535